jgi:type I restriction enzyme M protein
LRRLHRGDKLFPHFAQVKIDLEKALAEWGDGDEGDNDDESNEAPVKKGMAEKKKKKLLDAKTWERDGKLVEVATALRKEVGGDLFEDHNLFRARIEAALKKLERKLTGPELKFFLRAVSWRVETAPSRRRLGGQCEGGALIKRRFNKDARYRLY